MVMNKNALYLLKKNPKKLINKSFLVLLRKPIIRNIVSNKFYVIVTAKGDVFYEKKNFIYIK